jgi:hypothetical protein
VPILDDELELEPVLKALGLDEQQYAIPIHQLRAYVKPLLDFLPRSMPKFTDHGTRHSNNILKLLVQFHENLTKTLPSFSFSKEELFLLALSAYLHDIGCIIGRKNHNKHSARLLTKDPSFSDLPDKLGLDIVKCLELIAKSHSSNFNLNGISKECLHENVRLRLICAIFRLMDACEISAKRISRLLFDILTRNNKIGVAESEYWEAHLNIINLYFKDEHIFVAIDDPHKSKSAIEHLEEDLTEINKVFTEEKFITFSIKIVKANF